MSEMPPRPGVLKVFSPAFLAWGAVAAPDGMRATGRYLGWHSPRVAWAFVELLAPLALTIAVFGAIWVTRRYEAARDPVPMLINILGVTLAIISTQIVVL